MAVYPNYNKDGHSDVESETAVQIDDKVTQITIGTISDLSQQLEKSNEELKGVEVESRQYGKAETIESAKSIESLKSVITQSDINSNDDFIKHEKWYSVILQVLFPFLFAGFGTIGAGLILGEVEQYPSFQNIDTLYILVPAIIGLKGNLDMCLASRLSTQANLGNIDFDRETAKMVLGNIGLVQIQAIVAAVVVSLFAIFISVVVLANPFDLEKSLLIMCCSILTATLSCFVLDFVLTGVIIFSHKIGLNPDNMATPLASSIGDVVSLSVLSKFAELLYSILDDYWWTFYIIMAAYLFLLLPTWIFIVLRNKYTCKVLTHGWTPVLSALFISGMGGLILDKAVNKFQGYVVFQPIVNGVGGNLVSVYASRTSTLLHKSSILGILPPHTKQWVWPWTALFKGVFPAKTARLLLALAIPGQTLFVFVADIIYNKGTSTLTSAFVITYLTIVLIQVMFLLYIGHILIHTLWKRKIDPDTSAIPYLTALGDLFGSCFLLVGFMLLASIGREYEPVVL